ncbi:putative phosphotransferase system EIIC [Selenomonas ruminantium subsp. lactilytica TAM6421]|uniref:Permease IIC component n=1 Tax=Selenomonas ruminantium subsp. lactilytica (strain NBRC 103574 / TAM6421) TaxID=927704 RepID=I0GUI1_SELRL|nr:PTS transporter subunit EIIC [Selenomonas ruminantium]BAL84418.1 putative phosphotransferase system EIIC [Selenomonas ruminantium subsp. lactilytica TAM6421]
MAARSDIPGPQQRGGLLTGLIIPLTRQLRQITYLQAIQETFCLLMPFIILLTLLQMLGWLVLNPAGPLLGEDGLGLGSLLTGGLHGQTYRESAFFLNSARLRDYLDITNVLFSLLFALVLSMKLARLWQGQETMSMLCTASAYLFFITAISPNVHELNHYFMGRGFFLALLMATCSTWLFCHLARIQYLELPLVRSLPLSMNTSTKLFLPLVITLLASLLAVLGWIDLEHSVLSLPTLLAAQLNGNLPQTPAAAILYELTRRFLWWLGLNGSSFTFFWQEAFYAPAQLANEVAAGKYIFTTEFFDANSISLLGLAISIWVFASRQRLRTLSACCFPTLLLSINEPFLFALPIVLNPMFLIPYLLAPVLNVYIGYLAINWGIVPLFRYTVESAAPVFLQGWLATGDVMGAVLQLVWLSLDIVIYTPFVIIFNLLTQEEDLREEATPHEA